MLKYLEETTASNVTNQDIAAVESLVNKVKRRKEVSISYMKSWECEQMIFRIIWKTTGLKKVTFLKKSGWFFTAGFSVAFFTITHILVFAAYTSKKQNNTTKYCHASARRIIPTPIGWGPVWTPMVAPIWKISISSMPRRSRTKSRSISLKRHASS